MARLRPLAIDLFTGLHGWSEGLVAEGWRVVGFDLEDMCAQFGVLRPEHVQLVVQDVLTLHGSQFKDADLIVASPPCQAYSYMAMPWTKAKDKAKAIRADKTGRALEDLNRLFNACFRIQREACEASGRHIPLIVENVRGAQPWVGRSRWNYGSFHLWGDVPALMPITVTTKRAVQPTKHRGDGSNLTNIEVGDGIKGAHGTSGSHWTNPMERDGYKSNGMNWSDRTKRGQDFTRIAGALALEGVKNGDDWFSSGDGMSLQRRQNSKSPARKFASAMIAKIPQPLALHIASVMKP